MDNYKNRHTYGEPLTLTDIFQNVGYSHKNTLQKISINKEKVEGDFKKYREKCIQNRRQFDSYMDEFEQRRYMSPVELLVCTHYRDVDYLYHELFNRIDRFTSELSDCHEWNYCRCFGHKNIRHLLVNKQLYQNSHEYFYQGNAVLDMAPLLNYYTEFAEWNDSKLTEYFSSYLKINKLEPIELTLLGIYLLDPSEYFQAVEEYAKNSATRSMMDHVIKIKRTHRRIINLLSWSNSNITQEKEETD